MEPYTGDAARSFDNALLSEIAPATLPTIFAEFETWLSASH